MILVSANLTKKAKLPVLQHGASSHLRRNPPKQIHLRQGYGGYPFRIHPRPSGRGFLRRRVKAATRLLCAAILFVAADARAEQPATIDAQETQVWKEYGFSAEEALEWKYGNKKTHYMRRGVKGYSRAVYSVEWARQWKTAGFSSAEAKQCRLFDMKFEEALRWKHAGFTVQDAFQWKDSGFRTEEAAKKKDEGLTPVEAEEARHADAGQPGDEILSFHSDIVLHADSTLTVTENVEVQDRPGGEMQGYFKRVLAGRANLRHSEDSALTTAPSHTLLEVMKEGKAVNFSLKRIPGGI